VSQTTAGRRYPGKTSVTTTIEEAAWDVVPDRTGERHARTFAHDSDERRLLARLRAGEADAIEELYRAYRKPTFGFLVRLAKDRHVAEDLFQNTWLKVSRSIERLREDTELKAWIFTIARNEFRSYRRWQLVDLSRIFLFYREREEPECDPYAKSDEKMATNEIERGFAAIGASDREVLLIVCVEGMPPEQAATVLGISHAALRQRLGRARCRLKSALAKLETAGAVRARTRKP
jgi:RNA polymerase sigma-70 factor, ECF subfamily